MKNYIASFSALLCVFAMGSAQAQSEKTVALLRDWIPIAKTEIGQFSIRAIEGGDNFRSSLFKDQNNEYKWSMRIDYKKIKNNVAFATTNGYFNCDTSEAFLDSRTQFDKRGRVLSSAEQPVGERTKIPTVPGSPGQESLTFVCSVRLD